MNLYKFKRVGGGLSSVLQRVSQTSEIVDVFLISGVLGSQGPDLFPETRVAKQETKVYEDRTIWDLLELFCSSAVVKSKGFKAGRCQAEESESNPSKWDSSLRDAPILYQGYPSEVGERWATG